MLRPAHSPIVCHAHLILIHFKILMTLRKPVLAEKYQRRIIQYTPCFNCFKSGWIYSICYAYEFKTSILFFYYIYGKDLQRLIFLLIKFISNKAAVMYLRTNPIGSLKIPDYVQFVIVSACDFFKTKTHSQILVTVVIRCDNSRAMNIMDDIMDGIDV